MERPPATLFLIEILDASSCSRLINLEFSKLGFGQQLARHGIQLAKEAGYKTIAIGVISHKPWLQEWYRKRMGFKYMHNEKSEKIVEEWPAPVKAFLKDGYLETHFVKMRLRV